MLTQYTAIDESKKFISDLKNLGINLKKAYLFGSYSNQRQQEHSDIDIATISDDFTGIGQVDIKFFLNVLRNNKLIHAETYSAAEFEEGNPFIEETIKKGVKLL